MIYLDIETLDFFHDEHIKSLPRHEQIAAMRFGLAVTIDDGETEPRIWLADQVIDLYFYLVWCGVPVVGWNIDSFDLPVIVNNARKAGHNTLEIEHETINTIDIFAKIRAATGRWYGLGATAESNLNRAKLADGQEAAHWLRSGDPVDLQKAIDYCRADVEITRELHSILIDGNPLRLPPRAARGEINEIMYWGSGRIERVPDALGAVSTR